MNKRRRIQNKGATSGFIKAYLQIIAPTHGFTPGSMSLLDREIYQRVRVSRVADAELVLLIAHLIRPLSSIPGVG